MNKSKKMFFFMLTFALFLTIVGSQGIAGDTKDLSLKVGVMPAVDSAPIFLAEEKGYFAEEGLNVELQVYTNALNRQSALQTGALDGAMTDLIALVNNVENNFKVKITTSTDGSFPFLVNKKFNQDSKKINVGLMEVSVTNFLTEQYLGDKYKLNKVYINEIPARLAMVKAGRLDMAIVPEPMASMGQLNGLDKQKYEIKDNYMPEAMIFTERALANKSKAIEIFHKAYNKAVKDIKQDDTGAREILIERLKLKPAIKNSIQMPQYHATRLPSKSYMNKVIKWIEDIQGTEITVPYKEMIVRQYVD
jgi:NitT/TauT family transport system substrate-binding protein